MLKSKKKITFDLKGEIGKGGYGKVYKCVDENGSELATKCITMSDMNTPYLMEASIMSTINHPNLNNAIKIHPTNDKLYIVQELAEQDLRKWRSLNVPGELIIKKWIHLLLQAISCLHNQNIIHGDIKSSNILLCDDNIKLSDFTLSTRTDWPNKYQCCTCTHRPLEVWLNREWDKSVDIWALGCTIFEITYGYSLFPSQNIDPETPYQLRDKYINCLIDWVNEVEKRTHHIKRKPVKNFDFILPEEFDTSSNINKLILSMLKTDPLERPTAHELLKNNYFNGMKISKYTVTTTLSKEFMPSIKEKIIEKIINNLEDIMLTKKNKFTNKHKCILNLSYDLYCKLTTLNNISTEMKILTCIWISHKLINRNAIDKSLFPVNSKKIMTYECDICKYLNFRLHLQSSLD